MNKGICDKCEEERPLVKAHDEPTLNVFYCQECLDESYEAEQENRFTSYWEG